MESNDLNKPVYRSKRKKKNNNNNCKSNDKHMEEQKDIHEDIKKGHQNHKMWGRLVRKSSFFFLECV